MADIYIISSSPAPRKFSTFDIASSPPLPSVEHVLKKKRQPLRTGSRAAPIPQDAAATFTSASVIFKNSSLNDLSLGTLGPLRLDIGGDDALLEPNPKPAKAKARKVASKKVSNGEGELTKPARKTAVKKVTGADSENEIKKPREPRAKGPKDSNRDGGAAKPPAVRKTRAKKIEKVSPEDGRPIKEKPVRKSSAKRKETEAQTKIPKGKVTKVSTVARSNAERSKLDSAAVQSPDPFANSLDYGLVEAVKRRTTWTPPPPTRKATSITPASNPLLDGGVTPSTVSGEKAKGFADLCGSYGFMKNETISTNQSISGEATRKRKFIELVRTSVSTAAATSPMEKAPKKRPRTLTDQATAAYTEEDGLPTRSAPLLQYFPIQPTDRVTSGVFKIPPKPRSKSPVKGGAKAKKGSARAPILLSPESALKKVGNQDFVFGTSSQLAREDSPTLLRDLHDAMQASNEPDGCDPFADCLPKPTTSTLADRRTATGSTTRSLWSAASRDIEGDLLNIEVLDLVDSPVITRNALPTVVPDVPSSMPDEEDEDSWHDVEELSQSLTQKSQSIEALQNHGPLEASIRSKQLGGGPISQVVDVQLLKTASSIALPDSPIASHPSEQSATQALKSQDLAKPDFSAYTTAQLTKEIASYRFKPIKSRNQMIALLEKCWEGKNRAALGLLGTNTVPVTPVETTKPLAPATTRNEVSPKRPRGRPRKASTVSSPSQPKSKTSPKKTLETVEYLEMDSDTPLSQIRTPKKPPKKPKALAEDIYDSDTAITPPSPPRRRGSQAKTRALPLQISVSLGDLRPDLTPTSSQKLLFEHISTAVTSEPPAKDASIPSWHEKILLYDPIILEDLTVWLNTGALERAGWDGEVEPKEVKKWCENKSICCLWKENLRGGARSRY